MRVAHVLFLLVLSAVTFEAAAQQPAPAAPIGTGLITGQVIDATTHQPLGDAVISVAASSPSWPRREIHSDANGAFVIRDMPAGSFSLSARKPGYSSGLYGARFPRDSQQWFDLADGEDARDVIIRVWRTASVSGRIVDAADRPVFGMTVRPERVESMGGRRILAAGGRSNTTDRDGIYHLTDLFADNYVIVVPSPPTDSTIGFSGSGAAQAILGYPTMFYPGAVAAAGAEVLTLESGEDRSGVDFKMPRLRTYRVSGTIAGLAPADRTTPQAMLMSGEAVDLDAAIEATKTSITPDGRFTFPRVRPGRYTIQVIQFPRPAPSPGTGMMIEMITGPTGFSMVGMSPLPLAPMGPDPTLCVSLPVTVDDKDVDGVTATASSGARIKGQIVFDGLSQKPVGDALNHAAVVVLTGEDRSLSGFQLARIEEDRTFTTAGLPAGKYALMTMPSTAGLMGPRTPAWGPEWSMTSTSIAGRPSATGMIDLAAQDITGVAITMSDRSVDLSGLIRDADGKPQPNGSIYIFPTDRQVWTATGFGSRLIEVRPTRTGTYHLTRGMPGELYVVAALDARPNWRDPESLEVLAKSAMTIQLVAGEKKVLDLTAIR